MNGTTGYVYQNIIDYCTLRDITVKTFEEFCGLSNGTVSTWREKATASLRLLDKIQGATGIAVGHWIRKEGIKKCMFRSV